ncbi:MAG: hypothetical protein ACLFVQ_11535 [Chitinispirillaceae bacterium]
MEEEDIFEKKFIPYGTVIFRSAMQKSSVNRSPLFDSEKVKRAEEAVMPTLSFYMQKFILFGFGRIEQRTLSIGDCKIHHIPAAVFVAVSAGNRQFHKAL